MSHRGVTRISRSRWYRDELDELLADLKKYLRLDRPSFKLAAERLEQFEERWEELIKDEQSLIDEERRERLLKRRTTPRPRTRRR